MHRVLKDAVDAVVYARRRVLVDEREHLEAGEFGGGDKRKALALRGEGRHGYDGVLDALLRHGRGKVTRVRQQHGRELLDRVASRVASGGHGQLQREPAAPVARRPHHRRGKAAMERQLNQRVRRIAA